MGMGSKTINRSSPLNVTKRRRGRAAMAEIEQGLYDICEEIEPCTVRQVFYQAVTRGLVSKTEQEYKGTVCRALTRMRKQGRLPYDWLADNTRLMRKPRTYSSLRSALEHTRRFYRRALWD